MKVSTFFGRLSASLSLSSALLSKRKKTFGNGSTPFVLPTVLLLTFWSLGAFFSAWNYGKPVSEGFPFGVTYDIQEVRYSIPLHPVQLYQLFSTIWRFHHRTALVGRNI